VRLLTVFEQHAILVPLHDHVWVADGHQATLEVSRIVLHQPRQRLHRRLELGRSRPLLLEHVLRRQFGDPGVRRSDRCGRRSVRRLPAPRRRQTLVAGVTGSATAVNLGGTRVGCVLWDLSCSVVGNFCTAWRKSIRRIWNLPYQAHGHGHSPFMWLPACL